MLFVIRHATSRWNVPPKRCQGQLDIELTEAGRQAARERGRELPFFDAAYASHLSRAQQTAKIFLTEIAARDGHPAPALALDRRLAEAWCGHWEGIYHSLIQRRWPEAWGALADEDLSFVFPGGERLGSVLDRFSEAIEELDARHRHKLVLVVAHGGPVRLFLRERLKEGALIPGGPPANLSGFSYDAGAIDLLWPASAPVEAGQEGRRSPIA